MKLVPVQIAADEDELVDAHRPRLPLPAGLSVEQHVNPLEHETLGVPGERENPFHAEDVDAALAQEGTGYEYSDQVNIDETSWAKNNRRHWLWTAATPLVTVFLIVATRGASAAKQLLGQTFVGIIGSDRWSAWPPGPWPCRCSVN